MSDASLYEAIIDQFDVEENHRYRKDLQGRGETYCNIFVWDVTRAMEAEIPHWINEDGSAAARAEGRETTANMIAEWLDSHGRRAGWRQVDMEEAQEQANRGRPTITLWQNDAGPGHIAMVRPGDLTENGPLVAHAGDTNAARIRVADAFTTGWRRRALAYYVNE